MSRRSARALLGVLGTHNGPEAFEECECCLDEVEKHDAAIRTEQAAEIERLRGLLEQAEKDRERLDDE